MTVGERLKEERTRLGLSQTALGAVAGVGKATQINYEKDSGSPTANYLIAVATVGVDMMYVLSGVRTPRPVEGLSVTEEKVLDNYRSLPESDKASVRRLTDALAQSSDESERKVKS